MFNLALIAIEVLLSHKGNMFKFLSKIEHEVNCKIRWNGSYFRVYVSRSGKPISTQPLTLAVLIKGYVVGHSLSFFLEV